MFFTSKKLVGIFAIALLLVVMAGCAAAGPTTSAQLGVGPGSPSSTPGITPPSSSTITPPSSSAIIPPSTGTVPTMPTEPKFDPTELLAQVPESVQIQIRQSFLDQFVEDKSYTVEDVSVRLFGVFGETYAMFMDGIFAYADAITSDTVSDLTFCYPSAQKMYIYSSGQFYQLQEAFDAQLISDADIAVIYDNYYSAYPYMLEELRLLDGCQADLSDQMRNEITAYYGYTGTDDADTVAGKQYYGTYNGYVVLMSSGQMAAIANVDIGRRIFKWGSSALVLEAYKDGQAQPLKDVYEAGGITDQDLDKILDAHKAHFKEVHNWDYDAE